MPKAETTFRPIDTSDQPMHGHPAILISGFLPPEQEQLRTQLPDWGIADIPVIVIAPAVLALTLGDAARLPDGSHAGEAPELPRAVILSGLTGRQLNAIMDGYRQSGLPRPLWASVTPTSETWTVKYLLVELLREREAMREAMLTEKARTAGSESKAPPA